MKIALLGNANCGKTTLFNLLTKSNEATGNRAGVTFGAKEATLKSKKYHARIVDLPGIYSLTSQKAEERVALDYLKTGGNRDYSLHIEFYFVVIKMFWRSSHRGSVVMNLTSIHKDTRLVPGLT